MLLAAAAPFQATRVDSGIEVRLSVDKLTEGDTANVTVALADKATGAPLRGVYPTAWLGKMPEGGVAAREQCTAAVAGYLSGGMFKRAELDVNVYYVVTLNSDATLTVVDPRFSFGGSRLLAFVQLRAPGYDWALRGERLFVSMPAAGAVAVVDAASWNVVATVDIGANPGRVMVSGSHVWVAYDGGVAALDPKSGAVAARLPIEGKNFDFAASDDGRQLFVTAGASVAIVDTRALRVKAKIPIEAKAVSIAWSPLAKMAYVAREDGKIAVISPAGCHPERSRGIPCQQSVRRATGGDPSTSLGMTPAQASLPPLVLIDAEPGIRQIRSAPGGRQLFVVNPDKNLVQIVDTATNRVIQNGAIDGKPFEVTFSDQLAYIRRMESDVVLMVPLADLGTRGRAIPVVDFPAGQEVFGDPGVPGDGIVSAPGESAVLVSHPKDGKIYYYREGMAAPVGHFVNYGKTPRAVLVVDRTLRENAPGVFSTVAKLPHADTYNFAVFLNAPRMVTCFEVAVKPDPVEAARRAKWPKVEPLTDVDVVAAGSTVKVAFRVTETGTGKAIDSLRDAGVLVYHVTGGWNERRALQHKGDGRYETDVVLPKEGVYYVYIESAAAGLRGSSSSYLILQALEPES